MHREFVVLTGSKWSNEIRSVHSRSTSQSPSAELSLQQLTAIPTSSLTDPYVNMLHLELLNNVSSNAMSFFADGSSKDLWVETVLRVGFFTLCRENMLTFISIHSIHSNTHTLCTLFSRCPPLISASSTPRGPNSI
jgi:hypothetical protein